MLYRKHSVGHGPAGDPAWTTGSLDIVVGIAAAVFVVIASVAFGGFSFFEPWVIAAPLFMLIAGLLRGAAPGNFFLRALSVAAPLLCLDGLFVRPLSGILLGALLTLCPAIAGVAVRRQIRNRRSNRPIRLVP